MILEMRGAGILTGVVAAMALALVSSAAGSTVLLVNGETPSVRYQAMVDDMRIPVPAVTASLFIVGDRAAAVAACGGGGTSCLIYETPARIILWPDGRTGDGWTPARSQREVLYHEVAHLIDRYLLDDNERAAIQEQLGWSGPWRSDFASAHERFAVLAAMCAWPREQRIKLYWKPWHGSHGQRYLGPGVDLSRAQFGRACRLIRAVASTPA